MPHESFTPLQAAAWQAMRDAVEANPHYYQERWFHHNKNDECPLAGCGTPACIGGSGVIALGLISLDELKSRLERDEMTSDFDEDGAETKRGNFYEDADSLFFTQGVIPLSRILGLKGAQRTRVFGAYPSSQWPSRHAKAWQEAEEVAKLFKGSFAKQVRSDLEKRAALNFLDDIIAHGIREVIGP